MHSATPKRSTGLPFRRFEGHIGFGSLMNSGPWISRLRRCLFSLQMLLLSLFLFSASRLLSLRLALDNEPQLGLVLSSESCRPYSSKFPGTQSSKHNFVFYADRSALAYQFYGDRRRCCCWIGILQSGHNYGGGDNGSYHHARF